MKKLLPVLCLAAAAGFVAGFAGRAEAAKTTEEKVKDLEERLRKVEMQAGTDRVKLTGDFRFEVHSIDSHLPVHYDGMALQNLVVNTLFYVGAGNPLPATPEAAATFVGDVAGYIASHYGDYRYFADHLTFAALSGQMAMFPPEMQQQLMGLLMPHVLTPGYDWDNSILYTNRLRLHLAADVAENVTFTGRLSMYKPWGSSEAVQVFNGQPNSINIDGTTAGVPNSDLLRVERAYFDWKHLGGTDAYLSIGRRPPAGGPPMHLRQDEARGGSPLGTVIDFQFDGITLGYHFGETSTLRACYGLGYESGFGSASQLQQPADRLKDAQFFGLNWDVYDDGRTFAQATVARAFDVTDGFNGLVVLPDNPVTGEPVGGPVVMRFTPSTNLGDIDLASALLMRRDGPIDWFASASWMQSHPSGATTPFGGLFSDPFERPEEQDGSMIYLGARYAFRNEKTALGVEYNHGSRYWFNFAAAADDIVGPKTATRGDVWEAYLTHRLAKRLVMKLDYIRYAYDWSGSGWHLGTPKDLDSTPVLGYPTYDVATKVALSFSARF